jgi:chromate transporter
MSDRPATLGDVARVFLKIGAMSYGVGIMGIMQSEVQEKRQWLSKQQFVEGLALVNMLPGPPGVQLSIFLGHAKGSLIGGILAGLCFILPAFFIVLALSTAYVAFGTLPTAQSAFYGIGPVVVGIFAVSVYRLGRNTVKERAQIAILVAAAALILLTPVSLVATLLAAGCVGIALFHSRRIGLISLAVLIATVASYEVVAPLLTAASVSGSGTPVHASGTPGLGQLAAFFFEVGAFSFGGGLSLLAFIQDQVVNQFGWLTPQEFIDGLALGQLTPGPVLMLAAFIGFKLSGVQGAAVAASAIFLPSFIMMLAILPLLQKMKDLQWLRAFMRGVGPAVIGALAVSLMQMAPHAAPDVFTWVVLALTIALILLRNAGALPLMVGGGAIGLLRTTRVWERIASFAW